MQFQSKNLFLTFLCNDLCAISTHAEQEDFLPVFGCSYTNICSFLSFSFLSPLPPPPFLLLPPPPPPPFLLHPLPFPRSTQWCRTTCPLMETTSSDQVPLQQDSLPSLSGSCILCIPLVYLLYTSCIPLVYLCIPLYTSCIPLYTSVYLLILLYICVFAL